MFPSGGRRGLKGGVGAKYTVSPSSPGYNILVYSGIVHAPLTLCFPLGGFDM